MRPRICPYDAEAEAIKSSKEHAEALAGFGGLVTGTYYMHGTPSKGKLVDNH